jgi:hypothetical protein
MTDKDKVTGFGWFSAKQSQYGTYRYETPSGEEVIVTTVTQKNSTDNMNWDDLKRVGPVTKWISSNNTIYSCENNKTPFT